MSSTSHSFVQIHITLISRSRLVEGGGGVGKGQYLCVRVYLICKVVKYFHILLFFFFRFFGSEGK